MKGILSRWYLSRRPRWLFCRVCPFLYGFCFEGISLSDSRADAVVEVGGVGEWVGGVGWGSGGECCGSGRGCGRIGVVVVVLVVMVGVGVVVVVMVAGV